MQASVKVDAHGIHVECRSRGKSDFQTARIDLASRSATFSCDAGGTTPLYVRSGAAELSFSYRLFDLYRELSAASVDELALVHALVGDEWYGSQTVFKDVRMVTERASLTWSNGSCSTAYPGGAPVYAPSELAADVDVVATYLELVEAALDEWGLSADAVLAEFSGGLDSAIPAALLARKFGRVRTCGLNVTGPAESQQRERREEAVRKLGFCDTSLSLATAPLLPATTGDLAVYFPTPINATQQTAFRALYRLAGPAMAVVTGMGGDELLLPHYTEVEEKKGARTVDDLRHFDFYTARFWKLFAATGQLDRAPVPVVPISCLQAHAALSWVPIESGLWPINPMCHPNIVMFCRSLPRCWRSGKRLHREAVERLGYPAPFLQAPLREDFVHDYGQAVGHAANTYLHELFASSLLGDLGLIEPKRFLNFADSLGPASTVAALSAFQWIFNFEIILRRLGVHAVARLAT